MYYRMSRLHFEDDRLDGLLAWAESARSEVEAIDGLVFADIVTTGSGEGMLLAAYEDEPAFEAASGTVAGLVDQMTGYLTDKPHVHAGTSRFSFID